MRIRFLLCLLFSPSLLLAAAVRPVVVPLSAIQQSEAVSEQPVHEHKERVFTQVEREKMFATTVHSVVPQAKFQQDTASEVEAPLVIQMPVLTQKFQANAENDFTPGDPIIAAGPNNVVTVTNTIIAIYSKAGGKQFSTTFRNWFASLVNSTKAAYYFDPKVLYDQYDHRYIFMCLAGRSGRSWVFFSVSQTSDPRGNWAFWALDMQLNNLTQTHTEADFPGLGVDPQAIYITANMYVGDTDTYAYAKVRILKKSQVYASKPVTWHDFINLKEISGQKAINVQPAHCFDNTAVEYLVETNAVSGNKVTLFTIKNPVTTPQISKRGITVSAYSVPPGAAQKGGPLLINTGDSGVLNAVFRNGSIYTAHSMAHNWGSGKVSAVRFYEIKPTGTLVQEITFGKPNQHYFYPAVMADSRGNIAMVYNNSGTEIFSAISFTGRLATDPLGTFMPSARLRAGTTYFNDQDRFSGLALWGDYSGIASDSDDSFWIYSMFPIATLKWSTQVGHIHF